MAILHLGEILELMKRYLKGDENVVAAYLFGSYSRGDFTSESDLDILVISERPAKTREMLYDLSWDIQMMFDVPVSFIVISRRRWERGLTPLREVVDKEGRLIWMRGWK